MNSGRREQYTVAEPIFLAPATHRLEALKWAFTKPVRALSSAPVGGGLGSPRWIINVRVPTDYSRTDLDVHIDEVARSQALTGPGIGTLTAARVSEWRRGLCEGVVADATVGVSKPTWAADPAGGWSDWSAGTINLVVQVPVPLHDSAAVNAVSTATEAKTQALIEAAVPGTGTASDTVTIVWPDREPTIQFGGPRSEWGSRVARATHAAVRAGLSEVRR